MEWSDSRFDYGEIRYVAIGEIKSLEFACVYAMRDEIYRANRKERRVYHQATGDEPKGG